jgi:hypothetical protein
MQLEIKKIGNSTGIIRPNSSDIGVSRWRRRRSRPSPLDRRQLAGGRDTDESVRGTA